MSQLTKTQFETLYGLSGTTFPDNTTGDISEGDMRTFGDDIADSFVNNTVDFVTATISVPSAQVLTLNSAPKQLVAAPGAGKIVDVLSVTIYLDYNSVAYAGAGATACEIVYDTVSSNNLNTVSINLTATNDSFEKINLDNQILFTATDRVNTGIYLMASGSVTTGNSDLKVFIAYRIITI